MIIHSPIISGSLTFASGATFVLPSNGQYTGSFSGSVSGIGDTAEFSASLNSKIENLKIDTGSQDARLDSIESFTSSIDTTIKNKLNTENVISGSSQVLGGTGIVSSSAQIDSLFNIDGLVSSSTQVKDLLPAGTISGSSQLTTDFDNRYLNTNGDGVVSGSSQITLSSTTGFGTYIDQALLTTSTVQFGKVGVGGASDATYELKVTGDIGATGDIVAYISSDERLKDNINLIHNPIEKVKQLRGVTWEWNDLASDAARQSPNVGVIAQDVEKVLPMLVFDRENGYKGVDYSKLIGLLIEVVKEQQEQIEDIRIRLK